MTRDRRLLSFTILLDVAIMFLTIGYLKERYIAASLRLPDLLTNMTTPLPESRPAQPAAVESGKPPVQNAPTIPRANPPAVAAPAASEPSPAVSAADAGTRRILFTYRNSKPRRVEIIGAFNNWTPEPLRRGANHVWSISIPLAPGDYTYAYLVDGNVVRDPNNARTSEGRSLLTVKPIP